MEMFEYASRLGLRFESPVGVITTEDLWNLPLISSKASLDTIAKKINKAIKESEEESFVTVSTKANTILNLQLDIVKHIIKVKLAEKEANEQRAANKIKKEKILSILAAKEDNSLQAMSESDLKKMLDDL